MMDGMIALIKKYIQKPARNQDAVKRWLKHKLRCTEIQARIVSAPMSAARCTSFSGRQHTFRPKVGQRDMGGRSRHFYD
jgi:hypothetical protein